jgi:high affinity Mn2+ porin
VSSLQEPPPREAEVPREEETRQRQQPGPDERWNLFYQATSIGQYHGSFRSPYEGANSLQAQPEARVSVTTTLFFCLRLARDTQLYFDPEIAGGKGFSDVTGIANFTNGEIPRVPTATPKPYIARLYITQDFGFGAEKERFESAENQLAGERPMNRYSISRWDALQ